MFLLLYLFVKLSYVSWGLQKNFQLLFNILKLSFYPVTPLWKKTC